MNLFKWLFKEKKPTVTCPRCLGKGQVDWSDVKRLNKELYWGVGKCAFCNGQGKVSRDMESKIPADLSYLTTDLPMAERMRLMNDDPRALERARLFEQKVDAVIQQIRELYFIRNLEADAIADELMGTTPKMPHPTYVRQKKEFIEYVNRVIEFRKK